MHLVSDTDGEYLKLDISDFGLPNVNDNQVRLSKINTVFQDAIQNYPGKRVVFPSFDNNQIHLVVDYQGHSAILPTDVDFNDQTFIITNINVNHIFMFELSNQPSELSHSVSKTDIDTGRFQHFDDLKGEMVLLSVTDNHFWAFRNGSQQGNIYRKDILLLKHGFAQNAPIHSYSTSTTYQTARFCNTTNELKTFKNLKALRRRDNSPYCTYVTNLLKIDFQNNVLIENVYVGFVDQYGCCVSCSDQCFKVCNSTNISFRNVNVFGTYSNIDSFGYSFCLDNVWNCVFENVTAFGNWGVFGCNSVNKLRLTRCTLNRVDIHSYGKDVYCSNCCFSPATREKLTTAYNEITNKPSDTLNIMVYSNLDYPDDTTNNYNRFDNLYGQLFYEECTFEDFIPLRVDDSYHIYTGFDMIFKGGTITVSDNRGTLVELECTNNILSNRPENSTKELPNVFIEDTLLKRREDVQDDLLFAIFSIRGQNLYSGNFGYISFIKLLFASESDFVHICLKELKTINNSSAFTVNCLQRQIPDTLLVTIPGNEGVGRYVIRLNQ